jgi:hypothetical protein
MIFPHSSNRPNFISSETTFKSDSPTLTNTYTVFKDKMYVIENKALREIKLSKLTNIVCKKGEIITLILCVIVLSHY